MNFSSVIIVQKILSLCLVHINNNIASLFFNMSKKRSVFVVFSVLISGLLLFAIWSNIYVYAQQQPPAQSRAADSLTPELKAKMCDPTNPSLKVVNATESRICGIPRTVKPHTPSAATPLTSSVSSSAPQQTTTTKPTSVTPPHAKQQITNTNANVTSQTTDGVIGSKIAPATHLTNSLSSSPSSSPSHIAPQVKAVNQPQQQHQTPITRINGTAAVNNTTAGQNYTFTPTTSTSDKIMYLGYPGYKSNPSNSPTDKSGSSPNLKPFSHSTRSTTTTTTTADSGSTDKKQSSSATTKSDNTRTINIDDSNQILKNGHHIRSDTQDSHSTTTKTSRLPSDLASAITNKVHSFIRNSMKGLIHKTPFILPFH
jgi:hypothetical protein